ncbi:conserved membrane protein, unknown function [Hepatocystis sp. ex Piliocolobus tephrosceles]|nr:conserved membrane protein, unknown function [Hepatocystis sp. ex Piliocolobus tephrosceles]
MDVTENKERRGISRLLNELYINWNYRRQSWRISFYYNCLTIIAILNIIITLIFQHLIKSFNFFVNYSCDSPYINFILNDLLTFMILACFTCFFAFFLSRICAILSNFTMNDFMSLGNWNEILGCTAKWFPWIVAILFIFWFLINTFNLCTLYIRPNLWCRTSLNTLGTYIVENCRIFEGKRTTCTSEFFDTNVKIINNIIKCNNLDYLKDKSYLTFIPDLTSKKYTECTFNNTTICNYYKDIRLNTSKPDNIQNLDIKGCLKNHNLKTKDFYNINLNNSDLYTYLQIYIIGSNIMFFLILFFFFFVKRTTHFDGLFYQSITRSDMLILRFLRFLIPWT